MSPVFYHRLAFRTVTNSKEPAALIKNSNLIHFGFVFNGIQAKTLKKVDQGCGWEVGGKVLKVTGHSSRVLPRKSKGYDRESCHYGRGVYSLGVTGMYCMSDLMNLAAREAAEEFRLEAGRPPEMVLRGKVRGLDLPPLTEDNVMELFRSFASPEQIDELGRCGDVHFNHVFQHSAQFAVVALMQHEHITLKLKNLGR